MEASSNIFPVFGDLHADDPPAPITPPEKSARKVFENPAGLFVVSRETQSDDETPDDPSSLPFKIITGHLPEDLATALYCLALLAEFFNSAEPGDLRQCADEIRGLE